MRIGWFTDVPPYGLIPPHKVILGRKSCSYGLKMADAEMIDKGIIISWYLNWMFLSFI